MNNIFQYLEKTKGKPIPLEYKLINNIPFDEKDLYIYGTLDLYKANIDFLPDNLTVDGDCWLSQTSLNKLPKNFVVNGSLLINFTKISELPEDLYVKYDLYCYGTPLSNKIKNNKILLKMLKNQIKEEIFYGENF